jgi:hypothetical protein
MIRSSLHHDVAGAHRHFANVDQKRNLAIKYDPIVDGLGPVHVRMARTARIGGSAFCPNFGKLSARLGRIEIRRLHCFGWDIEHPNAGTAGWGVQDYAMFGGFSAGPINARRSLTGVPNFIERGLGITARHTP